MYIIPSMYITYLQAVSSAKDATVYGKFTIYEAREHLKNAITI